MKQWQFWTFIAAAFALTAALAADAIVRSGTWLEPEVWGTVADWVIGVMFGTGTVLFAGLAYMLLGYSFVGSDREVLTGWLYTFGVFGFLGAAFALGEWKPNQSLFWEAIYPGLVFGIIFLSTHLKSRIFLIFGSLALGAYLSKITAEYFSDSLGWAFSLVIVGFLLMGVAYLAVRLNRRYVA